VPPTAAQYVVTFLKPEMLHVYRQITALEAWKPVVFCQKRENPERFPFDDVVVQPKPSTHQLRRLWQKTLLGRPITIYRSEARRLRDELRRVDAKVAHIYFGHIGVHLLPFLELADRPPAVVSFHGADAQIDLDQPVFRQMTQRMFALASRLLVRSDSLAERLIAHGAPREKIRLHRTGLPLGQIAFLQRSVPSDGAWRLLQACRLIPKKGLLTSLRTFAQFAARWPKSTFTIAGTGPMLEELKQACAALGLADKVRFVGFITQTELRKLEAASHFFLHPSELGPDGDQEGVPNAMLEAMASGLPVLATHHGGIPEAVEHGISGLLVSERDADSLARELLALAGDPVRFADLGASAAKRVAAEFDLRAQTRRLESIYAEAAEDKSWLGHPAQDSRVGNAGSA
jgi:colanic acid/amylovoran biosynthesis glycosyltransferase